MKSNNFLGLPFAPWVKRQIEVRQEALGKYNKISSKDLQYYNTKTPFLRLASSVNLTNEGPGGTELENSVLKKLIALGYNPEDITDDALAKKCILQGGVVSTSGTNDDPIFDGLKFGLNNGSSIYNGSYGFGGISERGYVPMPGIINANVNYYSNGALSKAVVNIKCFSKTQFQLIDVLYLRPGYTVLLEFGWSQYLSNGTEEDSTPKLETFPDFFTPALSALLQGSQKTSSIDQFTMNQLINRTKRLSSGNYDAVYGKISNFNWNFNQDGSYDVQLTITGMGELIESLKVNITNPGKTIKVTVEEAKANEASQTIQPAPVIDDEGDDDTSWFGSFVNWITGNSNAPSTPTTTTTSAPIPTGEGGAVEPNTDNPPPPPIIANANATKLNQELYTIYQSALNSTGNVNLLDYPLSNFRNESGGIYTKVFSKAILSVVGTTTDSEVNSSPQVFIKYGALLAFIQSNLLLYDKNKPIVTFDMDFLNIDEDKTVILRIPGQFSADPRICLIPYTNTNIDSDGLGMPDSELNQRLKESSYFYDGEGSYLGRLSNIFLNVNYLAEVLSSAPKDAEGGLSLLGYLKSINAAIIQAIGGINDFEVKLSDDNSKIRFIEEIPQRFSGGDIAELSEYSRFNIFGVKPGIDGSFVRGINLHAEISGELSSMIVIGSQVNSNQISANSTSFGNYNAGLIDRIIPSKESFAPDPNNNAVNSDAPKTVKENWTNNIYNEQNGPSLFEQTYGGFKWISENLTALTEHNKTHCNLILGALTTPKDGEKQLAAPFFLPFKLDLEIDGLSGIKLYEKFLITEAILPPSYEKNAVDLQVNGLNHSITPSSWTTIINAISVPASIDLGAPIRPADLQSVLTTQPSNQSGGGPLPPTSNVEAPPGLDPLGVTRFNAMQASYNGVFARDGAVAGMCAQWSYNLAVNYVEFLKGRSLKNPKLRAGGNANQNNEFFNNLTKIGYTKTVSTGLSKATVLQKIANTTWGYGDVLVYYANDGDPQASHKKYGHAQIYVGTINSSGWSTSTADNYGTSMVYRSRNSDNWDFIIFRAPES